MKRFLIAVVLVFLSCSNSFAQQSSASDAPATADDVQRYLDVMHARSMINDMMAAMSKPLHQMVHDQYMKDKDKLPPDFEEQMNKSMDDMFKDMPWDEMIQAMVPAYQKHLTKGDIDALIAFYSSPTGQKILREMPAMMSDAMESMTPMLRRYMERVNNRVQNQMAALLKDSQKKSGASHQ